jgi:hypothetical protein
MSIATAHIGPGAARPAPTSAPARRAVRLAALTAAAMAVFGATLGVRSLVGPAPANVTVAPSTPMPRSPEIESTWGVRITSITLLADTGVIDVRYTVLDDGKAARLHVDGNDGLPELRTSDHGTVFPEAVMFHFHSKADQVAGQGYDIVYGNAHGALHVGSLVTVVMSDGLELRNAPVRN